MSLTPKQNATLESAQRYFNDGLYERATPLLNALTSQEVMSPDVYHMLGTICYEQGQFKASIISFKKALHIDPYFTDSSIGLSVVLNDLGKYEQAKEVFKDAQQKLKETNSDQQDSNTSVDKEIAEKHLDLSKLYAKANQPDLAFKNLVHYEEFTGESLETVMEKASLQKALSNFSFAAEILKSWWADDSELSDIKFFLTLSEVYYLDRKVVSALSVCEHGLKIEPQNKELINLRNNLTKTEFDLRPQEI